jgi:hypothetical protein
MQFFRKMRFQLLTGWRMKRESEWGEGVTVSEKSRLMSTVALNVQVMVCAVS